MDDDERYMQDDDPYNGVTDADISPDFTADALGESDSSDSSSSNASSGSSYAGIASQLRKAEQGASAPSRNKKSGDNPSSAKKAESDVKSDKAGGENGSQGGQGGRGGKDGKGGGIKDQIKNRVAGKDGKGGGIKDPRKTAKRAKRVAPLISIAVSMFGGTGLMMTAQTMLPYSLSHIFGDKLSSIDIANQIRFNSLLPSFLGKIEQKSGDADVAKTIRGGSVHLTDKQINSLKAHHITTKSDGCSTDLCYKDKYKIHVDNGWFGNEGDGDEYTFEYMYAKNNSFHLDYSTAVATWRTSAAALASRTARNYYKYRGVSRFINRTLGLSDKVYTLISNKIASKKATGTNRSPDLDEDGNIKPSDGSDSSQAAAIKNATDETGADMSTAGDIDEMTDGMKTSFNEKSTKFAKAGAIADKVSAVAKKIAKGAAVANFACTMLTIASTFYQLIDAFNSKEMISIMSVFLGAIDMAITGDSSELSRVWPDFTKTVTQSYFPKDENGFSVAKKAITSTISGEPEYGIQYDSSQPAQVLSGSSTTSEGVVAMYEGRMPDTVTNPSAQQFNFFSTLQGLSKTVGFAAKSFEACSYAKLAASIANFVGDIATAVSAVLTGGATAIARAAIDKATELTISMLVSQLVNHLVPTLAMHFAMEWATKVGGEDFGNLVSSAAQRFLGEQDQWGGGMAANSNMFSAYKTAQAEVIADRARLDRERYSPFDVRSSNTFLGSIVTQLVPVSSYMGVSLGGTLKSFGNLFTKSIANLSPTAHAAGLSIETSQEVEFSQKNCTMLSSVNAIGDAFCSKQVVTDISTAGVEATAAAASSLIANDVEQDASGAMQVKENSHLGKWLKYCGRRTSPLGVADQNIASDLGVNVGVSTTLGSDPSGSGGFEIGVSISDAPIVGPFVDILNNSKAISNAGYITGESCVLQSGGGTSNRISGVDIGERKIYEDNVAERQDLWSEFIAKAKTAMGSYFTSNYQTDKSSIMSYLWNLDDSKKTALAALGVSRDGTSYDPNVLLDNDGNLKDNRAEYIMVQDVYKDFMSKKELSYSYYYPQYYMADCSDHSGVGYRCTYPTSDTANQTWQVVSGSAPGFYYSGHGKEIGWGSSGIQYYVYSKYAKAQTPPYDNIDFYLCKDGWTGCYAYGLNQLSASNKTKTYNLSNTSNDFTLSATATIGYRENGGYYYYDLNSFSGSWSPTTTDVQCPDADITKGSKDVNVHIRRYYDDVDSHADDTRTVSVQYITGCNGAWDSSKGLAYFGLINGHQPGDAQADIDARQANMDRIEILDTDIFAYEQKMAGDITFDAIIGESATGDEARVYHRWAEDQRLLGSMGITDNLVEKYYETLDQENDPTQLSELEILARDSGLLPETVLAVLDGVDLMEWMAQYDPSYYYPTPAEYIKEPDHELDDGEQYNTTDYLARVPQQFFEDRRQRNFAA